MSERKMSTIECLLVASVILAALIHWFLAGIIVVMALVVIYLAVETPALLIISATLATLVIGRILDINRRIEVMIRGNWRGWRLFWWTTAHTLAFACGVAGGVWIEFYLFSIISG